MTEETEQATNSKAVKLINIASDNCRFFCDQHGSPFVFLKNPGKTMQLNSREFKTWLVSKFFDETGEAVGSDAYNAAVNVLEAKASGEGRCELETRCFKESDEKLIVDLANKDEQVVVITPAGWTVGSLREPRFRRYSHMLPMEVSDASADLREFVKFWRLKEPDDDVLLVGWIGHAFVAGIPHAINVAMGPKGSTKTSMQRAVRELVDPSSLEDMTMADRGNEIIQQLSHHYIPLFDNVSRLQPWQADDFCRASTGAGFTKRSLYTDEDDVIFRFKRVVMMNGINTPTHRGDFLDRALLFECSRVPPQGRMEENAIRAKVDAWMPGLRRSIFNALVIATKVLPQVRRELTELPRMADFAIWGEAFCRGIGYAPLEFYKRLMAKVDEASFIALENDPVAELIAKLFEDRTAGQQYLTGSFEFEGTASQLLGVLQHLNEDIKHVSKRELPSSPEALSRHLGDIASDLEEAGIKVLRRKTTGGKRVLSVSRVPPGGSKTAPLAPLPPLERGPVRETSGGISGGVGKVPPLSAPLPGGQNVPEGRNDAQNEPKGASGGSGGESLPPGGRDSHSESGRETKKLPPGTCGLCEGPLEPNRWFMGRMDGKDLVVCEKCWNTRGPDSRRPKKESSA